MVTLLHFDSVLDLVIHVVTKISLSIAILMYTTAVYTLVNGAITRQKPRI